MYVDLHLPEALDLTPNPLVACREKMAVLQLRPAWEQLRNAPQVFEHIQQQLYPVEYIAQEHVSVFHSLNVVTLMNISHNPP